MKKLFDEVHEYLENKWKRTVWYKIEKADNIFNFLYNEVDEYGCSFISSFNEIDVATKICELIKNDLSDKKLDETHYILYSERIDIDAIGDNIRTSLLIRNSNNRYSCYFTMSDFLFASALDELQSLCSKIESMLN